MSGRADLGPYSLSLGQASLWYQFGAMAEQKHHYIPEFYLKQWAGADGRLVEFCRRHQKGKNIVVARHTYPGGTGYQRGLYSIKGVPDDIKDVLENKFLGVADGQAATSLVQMVGDKHVPTGGGKAAWIRFVLSLMHRTPEGVTRSFDAIKKHYQEHNLEEARARYAAERRPTDPDTLEEFLEIMAPRAVSQANATHLLNVIQSPKVGNAIMRMYWFVVTMEGLRHPLLTSDRPIVMTNGLGQSTSHVVLPISPQHIFVAAASDDEVAKLKELSRGGVMAKNLNDRVARQARKFVYATDPSQLRFVENRLGEKMVWSPFE